MRALLVTLALVGAVAVPAGATPPVLEPGRGKVQPGMLVKLRGQPQCTGGFLFDGTGRRAGRLYMSLAAHCVEDEIGVVLTDEQDRPFGRVVASSWPYDGFADDWALVEIDRAVWSRVDPAMAGHPSIPTGVGTVERVEVGHRAQLSGWGTFNDHTTALREQRPGVVVRFSADLWQAEAVASPGDSGGPAADLDNGLALGSVSNLCVPLPLDTSGGFEPGCTVYGPTAAGIIARARAAGFPISLRLAKAGRPR
jgi:Trypsin